MAGYIGSKASVVSSGAERKKTFAITTTTTVLSGLSYTPQQVHVFHNGVRLVDGTDFTATDGASLTLTSAAQSGDEVVVISYATFQVSDTVSASAGGTFTGDVSVTGAFTSLGIDDNAAATAMTLDTSGNVILTKNLVVGDYSSNTQVTVQGVGQHSNVQALKPTGSDVIQEGPAITLQTLSPVYAVTQQIGASGELHTFNYSDASGWVNRMSIDSSGRVTMPYQPAFCSFKANNSSYPQNAALDWVAISNVGNHFNGQRFTAPVNGFYHFEYGGITHAVTNYFYIGFRINGNNTNGTAAGASWRHLPVTDGEYNNLHTSLSVHLSAGDYIEACTGYNGGVPYIEIYRSSFSGYLIG